MEHLHPEWVDAPTTRAMAEYPGFRIAPESSGAYLMLKENPKFSSTEKSNSGLQA